MLFRKSETIELKKVVPEHFDLDGIGSISARKIRTDLTPVLRRGENYSRLISSVLI